MCIVVGFKTISPFIDREQVAARAANIFDRFHSKRTPAVYSVIQSQLLYKKQEKLEFILTYSFHRSDRDRDMRNYNKLYFTKYRETEKFQMRVLLR